MPGWSERPVTAERDGVLHGTLTLPEGDGVVPGAVIVAGSGPTDRNGNVPGLANDALKLLAHGLAEQGVASVRADKRGVGASWWPGLQEHELRFGDYVRDAVAWAGVLRAHRRLGAVALLGHSEGALVVTMAAQQAGAAQRAGAARLVLLAGAGTPGGPVMERQFSEGGLPAELRRALRDT